MVTIIMPVLNGEKFIKDAIESINSQTHKISKLILADNNSKDKTIEIVKKNLDNSIKLEIHKSEKNLTWVENFFRCINRVETELFGWLAFDDYLEENWIEENIKVHKKYKDCVSSFGNLIFLNDKNEVTYPTGINKNMQIPYEYKKGDFTKIFIERQLGFVFYIYGLHNTYLFKKALNSNSKIKKLDSILIGGDTCIVLSLLSKGSFYKTNKTKFYRRNLTNSDGAQKSSTNIIFRIFVLELPISFFMDISKWTAKTFKKNRFLILLFLITISRIQSFEKIIKRIIKIIINTLIKIKSLIKNFLTF